jgi:hypothetical protein
MAKKTLLILIISMCCFNLNVKADEGMWLPLLVERLNYVDMQKMGCHLTADEIYSVNHSSLKDATVALNNASMSAFCTGTMVSAEGLMFTNHHCGYNYIENNSTVEKDYLTNGFWAKDKIEELRNDKLSATFLIYMEDVTAKILTYVNDKLTEAKRKVIVDSICAVIEKQTVNGTPYKAKILPFFEGNEFYMFVTETYKDVRLVGAPPESIGRFGADTDNWMWPRETGDFSIFRVYMAPDGSPAEYSKKNVPFKPKHFFPISLKGVKKDDFTMVLGFPQITDRYATSYAVKYAIEKYNPPIIKIREKRLSIWSEDMKTSEEVRIRYSPKYAEISNYYKYYIGQNEQLQKLNIYDNKVAIENAFKTWCNSDPVLKEKYNTVLDEIAKGYDELGKYTESAIYNGEALTRGIEMIGFAKTYEELYKQLKLADNNDTINKISQSLTYAAKQYFKNYNMETDKKICIAMMEMYNKNIPNDLQPDVFATIQSKYKGNITNYVNEMYEKSVFASKDKILEFLIKPSYKILDKDIAYITMLSFFNKKKEVLDLYTNALQKIIRGKRLFAEGIMEMDKNKKYYPNANSTMRLTYGKVTDYSPSSSTSYAYYTTLKDMMAKENPENPDFEVPAKLKQLYEAKNYGKYATDGEMRVCFITNNDITGGVSGAPTINADGELIGMTFDINWEATSMPFLFNQNYQRTINVDIKYVLFIVDKFAGATNIIKELDIRE